MTFAELQPRPEPILANFQFIADAEGPAVTRDGEIITAGGYEWQARDCASHGYLSSNKPVAAPDGYHSMEIRASYNLKNGRLGWGASFRVTESVFARVGGNADTWADAVAAVTAVDFKPQEYRDCLLYPHGDYTLGWVVALNDDGMLEIRPYDHDGGGFYWERYLSSDSPFRPLLEACGRSSITGSAKTRDEALVNGLAVLDLIKGLAFQLTVNSDAFEEGKIAGRAELKSAIGKL